MTDQTKPEKKTKSGSENRQRQGKVFMRATVEEKTEIESRAARAGLSVAGYLRVLAFGKSAKQPRAARRPFVDKAELVAVRYELRKIGGNLNQIAHQLNAGKGFDAPAFAALYAEHAAALKAIMAALGQEPER